MPGDRRVGLVAVGVNRTGVLTLEELKDAAAGAHEFADWLRQQTLFGVEPIIKVITDDEGSVTSRNIQNAVQEMINDGGLDLMILYFSGHGIVKNGDSEQVLLSEVSQYPDEAIDITATIKQAQKLRIPHIVIISDACRNAVDPFGPLGQVSGKTAILSTSFKGVRRPKVDVFYATEPSQTAKEYKGNGFFTQVLLEALIESPQMYVSSGQDFPRPSYLPGGWKIIFMSWYRPVRISICQVLINFPKLIPRPDNLFSWVIQCQNRRTLQYQSVSRINLMLIFSSKVRMSTCFFIQRNRTGFMIMSSPQKGPISPIQVNIAKSLA
ncbi:caspase family protein [Pectobacteriaceae bacterium C52]|nr:caspase family protein [Pectobacteriaceae bacterium C52]